MTIHATHRPTTTPAWAPPAEPTDNALDLDWVAIERAITGQPVTLTEDEQRTAARVLHGLGHTDPDAAARVGTTAKRIAAWRKQDATPVPVCAAEGCGQTIPTRGMCTAHQEQAEQAALARDNQVKTHIAGLLAAGWNHKKIAAAAPCDTSVIRHLNRGTRHVTEQAATRLLAVTGAPTVSPFENVDSGPAKARVAAIAAATGATVAQLASLCGISESTVRLLLDPANRLVTAGASAKVLATPVPVALPGAAACSGLAAAA